MNTMLPLADGIVDVAAGLMAAVVALLFVVVALEDGRTSRVTIATAKLITALAVGGLGLVGLLGGRWVDLFGAGLATILVTGLQLVPYGFQVAGLKPRSQTRSHSSGSTADGEAEALGQASEPEWIGRADVRLGIPFAWTLGWFGLGYAVVGFATALLLGLVTATVTRRRKIPFIPFLCAGLWLGLAWALARSGVLGG